MLSDGKGYIRKGAWLVMHHQQILWWAFSVNLILSLLGSAPIITMFSPALSNSIASGEISGTINVFRLGELLMKPEISLPAGIAGTISIQIVFFIFMLFLTGGTLVSFRGDHKLSPRQFFENCGLYFWRLFRLALISLIPFGVCLAFTKGMGGIGDKIAEATPVEAREFVWQLFGGIVVLLMLLFVRLWFDVAQVRAVEKNERSMWKNTFRAWPTMWKSMGTLLWMYFRISLVAWLIYIIGFLFWLRIPGRDFFVSFLVLEIVLFVQLTARLWLRSSTVTWYRAHAEEHQTSANELIGIGNQVDPMISQG
jgi:hypothetical protein